MRLGVKTLIASHGRQVFYGIFLTFDFRDEPLADRAVMWRQDNNARQYVELRQHAPGSTATAVALNIDQWRLITGSYPRNYVASIS